jgi:hypothetical protein
MTLIDTYLYNQMVKNDFLICSKAIINLTLQKQQSNFCGRSRTIPEDKI